MDIIREYFPILQHGFVVTVQLTVMGLLGPIVVAFAVGLARLSTHRLLRAPAYVFVEVFRGTSLVVQLFWIFYALPFAGLQIDPTPAAVLVLALNEGAYGAEVVRGTIATRPSGQTEACIALGLSPTQRLWRVLIPQSVPRMIPAFGNIMVDLLKATSLVSLVTVSDLTFGTLSIRQAAGGHTLVLFGALLVTYFVLSMVLAAIARLLEYVVSLDRPVPKRRRVTVPSVAS